MSTDGRLSALNFIYDHALSYALLSRRSGRGTFGWDPLDWGILFTLAPQLSGTACSFSLPFITYLEHTGVPSSCYCHLYIYILSVHSPIDIMA